MWSLLSAIPSSHLALFISRSQSVLWTKVKIMIAILKMEKLRHRAQQPQRKSPRRQLAELRTESHSPQVQPSTLASLFPSLALGSLPLIAVECLKVEGAVVMDTASAGCPLPWLEPFSSTIALWSANSAITSTETAIHLQPVQTLVMSYKDRINC